MYGICINLIILIIGTISDIKTKTIPMWVPFIGMIASVLLMFSKEDMKLHIWGILFGLLMVLIAFLSDNQFGFGDGMMIMVTGALNGIYFAMESVLLALIISSAIGMVLILIRKKSKEYGLPFIPFLLIGTIIISVAEVIQ